MAQTNFTPISLYYSTTASAAPTAGNLVAGELAINTNDGKLFYKDSSGVVQTIASKATAALPTTTTGSGNIVLSTSPTLVTPALGTPSAVVLTNATSVPVNQATGTLAVANGGTGLSSTPSNGQLDIGNGTGFTRATITAGSGISVTNGAGSITIASSGGSGTVTSVATGNGLSGGTITSTGTLVIAAPAWLSIGSSVTGYRTTSTAANTSYAGSGIQILNSDGSVTFGSITGTWLALGGDPSYGTSQFVRTS